MKFIEENKLKEAFWVKFKVRKNIVRFHFECPIRKGCIDLLTIDHFKTLDGVDKVSLCAFEFKLEDIKKAIAQAEENLRYAHKCFIVIPSYKKELVINKYLNYLNVNRHIGVICVDLDGRYEIVKKCVDKEDDEIVYNQVIAKMMLNII